MTDHTLVLTDNGGGLMTMRIECTAAPDAPCRRRPPDWMNRETWTDEESTETGHECWAVEWAAADPESILYSGSRIRIPVDVVYDEGVEVIPVAAQPSAELTRPREVLSWEDLGALPAGSVVLFDGGAVSQKCVTVDSREAWFVPGASAETLPVYMTGPFLVIYEPSGDTQQPSVGPTEAEIQAAARALDGYDSTAEGITQSWEDLSEESQKHYLGAARAALIAAREVSGR